MNCPSCAQEMRDWGLERRLGGELSVDVCPGCQAFWFDAYESLQLSPGSTLKLMKYIGEHSSAKKRELAAVVRCPRCAVALKLAHDMSGNVRFVYWRCAGCDGHFISFFDFLKEKNFIHPLSPQQVQELREKVQTVSCSHCGGSINLQTDTVCPNCHSAICVLDLRQQKEMLEQLKEAAEPRPADPNLPLKLALAKQQAAAAFDGRDAQWWSDARSGDLVQAGLNAVARWIADLVI
ncbi:MAG TPA: zf-TFIIB domain-containing protein [Candidatus Acidoferrales bacterium]|nr:zf-TFIIB domain-containing protein [Candidatus Acidoferrales bacterium]